MGLTTGTPVTPVGTGYIAVSNWYNQIWPNVPFCPNPKIAEAIVDAARDFLMRTELWTVELELTDIEAGKREYIVKSPLGEMVSLDHFEILNGDTYYRKTVIAEIAVEENPEERDDWRAQTTEDPDAGWIGQDLRVNLMYTPEIDITAGLKTWINIMPFDGAQVVPKILWTHYKKVIADRALAELLLMSNKPWANPQLGSAHGMGYEDAVLPARQKKFSGFTRHRTRDIITTKYTDF